MTVRYLMAGYTAYTDAEELAAMRGTHRNVLVTTTDPTITTTTTYMTADFDGPRNAAVLTVVRQVPENV
jgi:hypothetical protein